MKKINLYIFSTLALLCVGSLSANAQSIQTLNNIDQNEDPTKSAFKIVVCDGPDNPAINKPVTVYGNDGKPSGTRPYVVCDFNGAMITVQHLINIAMVLGVLAAIVLFTYAGFLLITGKEGDRKKAYEIFPKVFWGFIIMLSAWFIVYQLLSWLTGNSIFTKLLGNP